MIVFIFKRFLASLPVFAIVVSATFLFMRLAPGSPFGADRKLSADIEQRLFTRYQLDGSLMRQFTAYWANLLRGDLGDSIKYRNRTVADIIGQTFPKSALLGLGAMVVALGIGIVAGSQAALHHGSFRDHAAMALALAGICLPAFVLAPLLILLLAIQFPLFPVAGWGTPGHLVLPMACLGIPYGAYCARLMRTSMLDVLGQDYIRTARAKGLDERVVTYRHALRVAALPLVNYAGPLAANVLTGSLVIEEIFKIPGMGPFFVNAVLSRDIFLVGGCVIVYFTLLILLNLLADIATALLDRRIRLW
ncbi:MAG: ABC transporter permease [Candidatus Methylacidiphilales bacterium]|nr:ABC transporter permease [Candidatus Methylacidiphilales bacterium]